MGNNLLPKKQPDPIIVKNCPNCNSDNIRWQSAFDFKYRVICKDCGYHTRWHLNSLEKAVEEWNDNKKEVADGIRLD